VVIVVPRPYEGPGQIVLIAKRTQARRVQQKILATRSWTKGQPARSQHPNEVSAGEEQYIPLDAAGTVDHVVRPLSDLRRRFAACAMARSSFSRISETRIRESVVDISASSEGRKLSSLLSLMPRKSIAPQIATRTSLEFSPTPAVNTTESIPPKTDAMPPTAVRSAEEV
jgi:hypothetical protein